MKLKTEYFQKKILRTALIVIFLLLTPISVSASSTYSSGKIIITNGINNLASIYVDINNPSVLSKNGNTYILNSDMIINDGATLSINNSLLKFGGIYKLWNKGGGTLIIDDSVITSVSSSAKGWILNRRLTGEGYWTFSLTNSTVSKLGPGGLDEYGEARPGIFGYPAQSDGNTHAESSPIIKNNDFSDLEIVFGNVGKDVIVTKNSFHDISAQYVTQIQSGTISYNNFYNNNGATNLIYSLGSPLISNNRLYNNILISSGAAIGLKEGDGGVIIENNTIDNIVGGYGIYVLGSTHTEWGEVRNNTITNSNIAGIMVQGNAYLGGYDVLMVIENNKLDRLSYGILFSGNSNMGPNKAPRHIVTRNNIIKNSEYGYWVNGYEFYNVSSNNDSMAGNNIDMQIGDTYIDSSYPQFINPQYSTIAIKTSSTLFKNYKYLDIKVVDSAGNPIKGASIAITNTVDANYPSINIIGQTKTSFTTGSNGHTSLPSDPENSATILDFYETSSTQKEMSYTITATYNGYTSSTTVSPTTSWYRSNPNTYQNTVVITLQTLIPTPALTPTPSPTSPPTPTVTPTPTQTQSPYSGTPLPIPGIIQAEDFDNGGEGIAYHDLDSVNQGGQYRLTQGVDIESTTDTGAGYNIGWTQSGEWIEYTTTVSTTGTYTIETHVASNGNGGTFHIEFNGIDKTGPMAIPNTGGWDIWQTLSKTVTLNSGQQVMKIVMDTNGPTGDVGNINYIRIT